MAPEYHTRQQTVGRGYVPAQIVRERAQVWRGRNPALPFNR